MKNIVSLIKSGKSLTPFNFYSDFLQEVADVYQEDKDNTVEFKLIDGDDLNFNTKYFIDPISLPLFLSLAQQLKNHHTIPVKFHLSNTPITIDILEFLYRSDFFNIVGKNDNSSFPFGKNILDYDQAYLGGFKGKLIRTEHKVRCYSLIDDNLLQRINPINDEPSKRDFLVEYFSYKVKEHFYTLLYENENIEHLTSEFIEILAELITNGVLHSESDAFVLMFSDRYKTKFSISDNGIGLYESLKKKDNTNEFYNKFELLEFLSKSFPLSVSDKIKTSILSLFETLFYSMLKDRQGLFDLMCNVVINCSGYFRLHTDNAQIIVSARMLNELQKLNETRTEILKTYNSRLFDLIDNEELRTKMIVLTNKCKKQVAELASSIFRKYSEDTRFSSIRIFDVKFRGVHIEVEIPNKIEKV
jgi:hypothetical protein